MTVFDNTTTIPRKKKSVDQMKAVIAGLCFQ